MTQIVSAAQQRGSTATTPAWRQDIDRATRICAALDILPRDAAAAQKYIPGTPLTAAQAAYIRLKAGAEANLPIEVHGADRPPCVRGHGYDTHGGWRYTASTRHVEVGIEWVTSMLSGVIARRSEGGQVVIDTCRAVTRHGITATPGYYGRKAIWWVVTGRGATRRTYHAKGISAADGFASAIRGWRMQARADRAADLVCHHPDQVWVSFDDSLRAGNCEPASEEFARRALTEIGATCGVRDVAVRGDVVLRLRDDSYTRRAVAAAATHA